MQPTLVCLHGWGGTKESFRELREELKATTIEILTPDLPGFGEEPEPPAAWTTDDYTGWVETWIREKNIKHLHLLGHSHGGRIALKLAARDTLPIEHLYLCAAAGIRHPRHLKRMFGLTLAKTGSTLLSLPGAQMLQPLGKKFLYKLVRVHDYEKASPVMRQTLINVSKEDLTPLLSDIVIPTDIFWGNDDRMTPLKDGKLMHAKIKGSVLRSYAGVRHRVHRDKAADIASVIKKNIQLPRSSPLRGKTE